MHSSTNTEINFFGIKFGCGYQSNPRGGSAITLGINTNDRRYNGQWCDETMTYDFPYICKAKMSNDY